jgi:hypothetical protein
MYTSKLKYIGVIITCTLFLFVGTAKAQKLKVKEKLGETHRVKATYFSDIIKLPEGGYLSVNSRYRGTFPSLPGFTSLMYENYFILYDEDLKEVDQKMFDLGFEDKPIRLQKLLKFGYDYFVFFTFDNEVKKKRYLFYSKFDIDALKPIGPIGKVADLKLGGGVYTQPSFQISLSENGNHVVIFGKEREKMNRSRRGLFNAFSRNKESENLGQHSFRFTYWLLDKDLEIVNYKKRHTLTIPESTDKFYVRDYKVDDNGAIYILGKNDVVDELTRMERRDKNTKKWVEYKKSAFILQKINPDGSSNLFITDQDVLVRDMVLLVKDNKPYLVGLLGEQMYSNLVTTGVLRYSFKPNGLELDQKVISDFNDEVLENVNNIQQLEVSLNNKQKKRYNRRKQRQENRKTEEEKQFDEIRRRALLSVNYIAFAGLDENNDVSVVLEERYHQVVTHTTTDANGFTSTSTTHYYHYDDLVILKFRGDEVLQNYFNKEFVYVNFDPADPMSVSLYQNMVTILSQDKVIRASEDLDKVQDYEIKSLENIRIPNMGRRGIVNFRKSVDDDTLILISQRFRKAALHEIRLEN